MTITVTLGTAQLTADEKESRARRAAEVLDGAHWVFDEFASERTADLLSAPTAGEREEIFREIQVAADLKAKLIHIVNTHTAEQKLDERRNRDRKPADHD